MNYRKLLRDNMWGDTDESEYEFLVGREIDFENTADEAVKVWRWYLACIDRLNEQQPEVDRHLEAERLAEEAKLAEAERTRARWLEAKAELKRSQARRQRYATTAISEHGKKRPRPNIPYDVADHPNA